MTPLSTALLALSAALLALGAWAARSYRRDMRAARDRLAAGGTVIDTACGPIEYAEQGRGPPVLIIHGAGGGYDQGLMFGETLLGEGYRIIAPSRFGYLNELPRDHSLGAQAEALACLLNELGIERAIVAAFSAGGPSGLTFARLHPERTAVLILGCAVSFTDGGGQAEASRERHINRIIGNDFVYWALSKLAWRRLGVLFGVTLEVQKKLTEVELASMRAILEHMSPLSRRLNGVYNDQAQQLPRSYPLGEISAPALVFHAEDDTLVPPINARHSAGSIPGADLITVPDGGHFMMGQHAVIRAAIRDWLSEEGLPPEC